MLKLRKYKAMAMDDNYCVIQCTIEAIDRSELFARLAGEMIASGEKIEQYKAFSHYCLSSHQENWDESLDGSWSDYEDSLDIMNLEVCESIINDRKENNI